MSTADGEPPAAPAIPGPPPRILLVRAPYYRAVVDGMSTAAQSILAAAQAETRTLDVAGAFELPQAIRLVLHGLVRFDGFVALGCVIRGETDHYDHICQQTMAGLMNVALDHGLALGTGLLTVDTLAQAEARSAAGRHNKGAEAAAACLVQIAAARLWGGAHGA